MRKRRRWLLPVAVPASVALGYLLRQQFAPCVLRPSARSAPKHPIQRCNDIRPPSDNNSCIQQYEWNKCGAPFLQNYCDRACGRCASAERREFFRRTVLVSARQHAPCASAAGDFWVGRAQQNKAEYARAHGMQLVLASALFDGEYEGAWNKLVTLHRVLAAELNASKAPDSPQNGWVVWADWDIVFTDLAFELPLDDYAEQGARLVVGGEPQGVADADYLKMNTGLMLLRVHPWSLALLGRLLAHGRKAVRHRHALEAQQVVKNLCVGCIDDQATLLVMMKQHPERWRAPTFLERRFMLQGYWEDYAGAMPTSGAALRRPVFGRERVPLSLHFAGCQLCPGKLADASRVERCWRAARATIRYAEDQSLAALGLAHPADGRENATDAPLRPLAGRGLELGSRDAFTQGVRYVNS